MTKHTENILFNQSIDNIVQSLTLDEKISLIHGNTHFSIAGIPRLEIPSLQMIDGPNGIKFDFTETMELPPNVREQASTYLPVGMALGSTWNPDLALAYGDVLGKEALAREKHVVLGPSVNIIRTPLCGRNFEYMSEDPLLTKKLAVPYIKGVQQNEVAACVKHYAANNQEELRMSINAMMSERALREIYLPAFEAAVKEGKVFSIMGAYNRFRGDYCCENKYLLMDILRDEWGFDGTAISDWGGVHSTEKAYHNGLDIEMGTELHANITFDEFFLAQPLTEKLEKGEYDMAYLDEKVKNILHLIKRSAFASGKGAINTKTHQQTAKNVALESLVLLKNKNNTLPIAPHFSGTIAVVGENAKRLHGDGGGAAGIMPYYEVSPLEGIQKIAGSNVKLVYAEGYSSDGKADNQQLFKEAVEAAKSVDMVIFCGGLNHGVANDLSKIEFDTEYYDKKDIKLPYGQDNLIKSLAKANPNTVVVNISGAAVEMPFIDDVPAVLQAFYPGMESGHAIAEVLFGLFNPSGKLTVTFPKKLEDMGAHTLGEYPGNGKDVHYNDDIYVGYRYFSSKNVKPLFAFGHGLSYTQFKYSDLKLTVSDQQIIAKVNVNNAGKLAGGEVVQLYVECQSSAVPRPKIELKGFRKIFLEPGETQNVEIELSKNDLSYFDEAAMKWKFEPGSYVFYVGSASDDIRLSHKSNI